MTLVTKLLLGHALVLEALLPCTSAEAWSAQCGATPAKQSFRDKRVPKQELGHEGAP